YPAAMTQAIRFLLDSLARDVAVGVRNLRKNPVVSLGAAVSLALALGACLTAITLVNALILRPLPVRDPGRLISLAFPTYSPERPESDTFNDPIFVALRDAARNHAALFAMSTQVVRPVIINTNGSSREKEEVRTQFVSGDAFARLGVDPIQGRLFTMDDDRQPVTERVAVISHRYWLRRFGGDAAVLGRSFTLEDKPFQIVGVTSSTFTGVEPGRPTDVWLPYSTYNPRAFGNRQFGWFRIMGRLNPGVTLDTANAVHNRAKRLGAADGRRAQPRRHRSLRQHATVRPVRRQRPVATEKRVRAAVVDPCDDCRPDPAHCRIEHRQPATRANGVTRKRDGAAPVDRRRKVPAHSTGAGRKRRARALRLRARHHLRDGDVAGARWDAVLDRRSDFTQSSSGLARRSVH